MTRLGIVLLLAGLFQGKALAQDHTAAWLFQKLADQADHEVHADFARDAVYEAQIWKGWAGIYRGQTRDPRTQSQSAARTAQKNVVECRQRQEQSALAGRKEAADFYRAYAELWADLAGQLVRGEPLTVRFPPQMTHRVFGLEGTPWAQMTAESAAKADAALTRIYFPDPREREALRAQHCASLEKRLRACKKPGRRASSHGQGKGSDERPTRAECHRLRGLYQPCLKSPPTPYRPPPKK